MSKKTLEELSVEELKKSLAANRTLFYIFVPIILALAYFSIDEYLTGEPLNMPNVVIIICSFGGMLSLRPTIKGIKAELKRRNN